MLVLLSRRTVGPFTAINGRRLGLGELARQLWEPGEAPCRSWPQTMHVRSSRGSPLAPARSLVVAIALLAAAAADSVSLPSAEITAYDLL